MTPGLSAIVIIAVLAGMVYLLLKGMPASKTTQQPVSRATLPGAMKGAFIRNLSSPNSQPLSLTVSPFRVGRSKQNILVLPDQRISKFHAEFVCQQDQWFIYDSGSTNGVFVNGRRISWAPLSHGDEIQLANVIKFRFEASATQAVTKPVPLPVTNGLTLDPKPIGGGTSSNVYRGVSPQYGEVAVKIPKPGNSQASWKAFQSEYDATRGLSHPNIVGVFDLSPGPDHLPMITMEFLGGGTLRQKMKTETTMPDSAIRLVAATMSSALAHAHSRGIVHRDVKPENIVYHVNGQPKLTDFGIAVQSHVGINPGEIIGTVHYMAPEQVLAQEVGPATDVYGLGCVLYELAAKRCPFEGRSEEVQDAHVKSIPEPVTSYNSQLSPELANLIMKMLEKRPEMRPTMATIFHTVSTKGGQLRLSFGGQRVAVSEPHLTVGRAPSNGLCIDDDSVAEYDHAILVHEDDGWHAIPQGQWPLKVNQRRIRQPQKLEPGDILSFGEVEGVVESIE